MSQANGTFSFPIPANKFLILSVKKQGYVLADPETTTRQYSYSFNPTPWEPFKDTKSVAKYKWIKELNLYYLPQSWSFQTDMHRTFNHMKMRDFNLEATSTDNMDLTFSKDFMWNRRVDIKYDLTKNIKFSFQSAMNATIDEGYYTPEIIKDYGFTNDYYEAWRDTITRSFGGWGKPYSYQQAGRATHPSR